MAGFTAYLSVAQGQVGRRGWDRLGRGEDDLRTDRRGMVAAVC